MTVRVIIPWRPGCPHREAALGRVTAWWQQRHPDWDLRIGEYPAEAGGWRKSMAVAAAGPVADQDTVIVSDADVICEQVDLAVDAIQRPEPRNVWAMPHRTVYRLAEHATRSVIDQTWWPAPLPEPRRLQPFLASAPYSGYPGGGLVVLLGRILNMVPLDPRFTGWGQEDHSWSLALSMMSGAPWRGHGQLWHLWHPPAPRQYPGVGSTGGLKLWHRYRSASTPAAMRVLLEESQAELSRLR